MRVWALTAFAAVSSLALADIQGDVHPFTSPSGLAERCVQQEKIPGGVFSERDEKVEKELCSFDFYRNEIALCPKTWSTSPGTIVYSTEGTGLMQSVFEATRCEVENRKQNDKLTKFKNSMNQKGTSATYSQASLLYYQFSRYFDTAVYVPVSVYRSMDKDQHLKRVSARAKGNGAMNIAGWSWQKKAEQTPAAYAPTSELFTSDLKQIYGVMLDDGGGERYGAEFNGIRSAWGTPQNNDFQQTPGYVALRSEQPLAGALVAGIKSARSASGKMAADLGTGFPVTNLQIGLWMRQLTEITLLDYIFNQQDRIGNIDYFWAWIYVNQGQWDMQREKRKELKKLERAKMKAVTPPQEIAGLQPELVQMSMLNDNDAGGKPNYVNFTAKTKMLEKIRHFDVGTYRKLMALNNDLQTKGALFTYLRDKANISAQVFAMIVKNTAAAASILSSTCKAGKLRFDLNLDRIVSGQLSEDQVTNCLNP